MSSEPRPASEPRHDVDCRLDVRIPVSDGLELSANLWLPVPRPEASGRAVPGDPRADPVPQGRLAPARRREPRALAGRPRLRLLPARRAGTGSSPGIALDEYTARETQDGFEAVEWLAAQPWSNGNVGMWGISYGGFTAIQVAKLRPPHLRAIVPMYATDDRYTDDVHYVGGCVTVSELSQYAVSMVGMNALPARPSYRGDGLARGVARPARADAGLALRVAPPAARRTVLAAGLARPRLRGDRGGDAADRRLDGRLRRSGAADARALRPRAAPGADRQLGPRLPGRRLPGPEPRLAPRARPVLRPLAQGRRQRGDGRAGADLLPARLRAARAVPGELAGRLAERVVLSRRPARSSGPRARRRRGRRSPGGSAQRSGQRRPVA